MVADIYRKFLVLSAGFLLRWQTYTGNSWFCLPGFYYGGRHIQEILGFVCRAFTTVADIYRKFLVLSAGFIDWRQTKHRKSIIHLLLPVAKFMAARDSQGAGMGG